MLWPRIWGGTVHSALHNTPRTMRFSRTLFPAFCRHQENLPRPFQVSSTHWIVQWGTHPPGMTYTLFSLHSSVFQLHHFGVPELSLYLFYSWSPLDWPSFSFPLLSHVNPFKAPHQGSTGRTCQFHVDPILLLPDGQCKK